MENYVKQLQEKQEDEERRVNLIRQERQAQAALVRYYIFCSSLLACLFNVFKAVMI